MTVPIEQAAVNLVADLKDRQGVTARASTVVVYRGDPEHPVILVAVNPAHPHSRKIKLPVAWDGHDVKAGKWE